MDHFGNDQDRQIVELLGRLKDTGPEYPPRLYQARRASILAALAALPLGGAAALSLFGKLSHMVKAMSVVDKAILAVEVVAITGMSAVGAAAAYIYRDELKALILSAVPTANVTPFPSLAPPSTEPVQPTPEATPSESATPSPTGTILFTVTNGPSGNGPGATEPPPPPKATEPGNRYGNTTRTPKPPPPKSP